MTRRLTPDERCVLIATIHAASNDALHTVLDALGLADQLPPGVGLEIPEELLDNLITELEEAL